MSTRYENVARELGVRQLGDHEKKIVETILNEYPEEQHVSRVILYANADFTDTEDAPSGMLSIHTLDAPVQPDSLPDNMFQYLIVCPVKNRDLTDAYFEGKEQKLEDNIVQFTEKPPRMEIRNVENEDTDVWDAELGNENSFAGVYKKGKLNHGARGREDEYFVVVQAGAPQACRQLKSELVACKDPITFEQLLNEPKFAFVKNIAKRNAERLAYQTARALGLRIQCVQDVSAKTEGAHIAKPFRACPPRGNRQTVTGIKQVIFKGEPRAGVYHQLRPTDEGSESAFVNAGPYNGLVIFQMRGTGQGFALPTSTGRKQVSSPLQYPDAKRRAAGITWEGKSEVNPHHPDLHPEAYHSVDDHFLNAMKKVGWQQKGVDNRVYLIPVLLKISNPKLKRKK